MIHLEMKNNPSAVACLAQAGVSNVHVFICVCGCRSSSLWMWPRDLLVRGWEPRVEWLTLENTLTRPGNKNKVTLTRINTIIFVGGENMHISAEVQQPSLHLHTLRWIV